MLDPVLLRSFREVAVRESFSLAAAELGFTQPAISQHIGRLEKYLDVKLLDRDGRRVKLTPAGRVLLGEVDTVLQALRRAEDNTRAAAHAATKPLRVSAFATSAASLVPAAAGALRRREDDTRVDIELRVLDNEPGLRALLRGEVDVALIVDSELRPLQPPAGVRLWSIGSDEMRVAISKDHPLATRQSIDLDELAGEPWLLTEIGGTCEDSNVVLRACSDAGFAPDVRLESEDYPALMGMAAAGVGVALVPTLATLSTHPGIVIRSLRGAAPRREIRLAMREGECSPAIDAFVDALREANRELAGSRHLRSVA